MKPATPSQALEYFQDGVDRLSVKYWDRWSGLHQVRILLLEIAQSRRVMTGADKHKLETIRSSAIAWFFYFRWKENRPTHGQMIFEN